MGVNDRHNTFISPDSMDIADADNETHDQPANNVDNLISNLNISVNTSPIIPYTRTILSSQLSNTNVHRTTVYNVTDVSHTTASYASCNFVNPQSYAPECIVSPSVNVSSINKVIQPSLSQYQALRYPRTHMGTKAVKKPTSAKHEVASKTKRSGIG